MALAAGGCGSDEPVQAQTRTVQPAQVEIAPVQAVRFDKVIDLPGRIAARRVAEVRARVAGIILSRDFEEGSQVTKGQILFHIDPAQFNAALAQAKADLAKAEASMADLKAIATRYSKLVQTKSISQQEYDTAYTNYQAAEATRNAAVAAVKTAQLNLDYATVTAPISGRIGRAAVTEGALVGEGEATLLATIQQLDPIYADISQPVSEYLKLKAAMNDALESGKNAQVSIELENPRYTVNGKLLFSDITVDQDTDQISLRSEFPNQDGMLLPGMYVRIRIALAADAQAIFVPQRAVLRKVDGSPYVFVVSDQNIAHARAVQTGDMQGSNWQITTGIVPGEQLVVNGVDKVREGAPVAAKTPVAGTVSASGNANANGTL